MTAIRVLLIVIWLFSPAIFLFFYVRRQWASLSFGRESARSWFAASSVAINWIVFVALLVHSQTPYGMIFSTSILTHILLAASLVGAVVGIRKWPLLMANATLVTLWIVIAYAPVHWLRSVGPGSVNVDGKRAEATVYFGYPTDSEAEAVAMVEIPSVGDYFLSFGEEKIKPTRGAEFVRLPYGIWVFNSLRETTFIEPLPPKNLNQFRIASNDGRIVEVQF